MKYLSKNQDIDTIIHKFYLIDTNALKEFNTDNHNFDTTVYQEL